MKIISIFIPLKRTLAIIFILFAGITVAQNDTMLKYFRTIAIKKHKVSLGGSIDSLGSMAIKVDDLHYQLKKEEFKMADSIGFEVNKKGKIVSIAFRYATKAKSKDTAYIFEVHKFQKLIGSPGTEYTAAVKDGSITVTKWENKTTIFEVAEHVISGKRQKTYSMVFDKDLIEADSNIKKQRKKKGLPVVIIRASGN